MVLRRLLCSKWNSHVTRRARITPTRRQFSTGRTQSPYDDTVQNLKIGKNTRVVFQGFTGRQATANAKESIAWGTNIVGGVTPNKEGEHLGLPVLPSMRKAMEVLKPDATGVYVAAHQAAAAIEEAIEAEVPLIVAVAEHIPLHDILRISSMLRTQNKSRLVGANAPGIISAIGRCRIGFQPLNCFLPGHVGVIAKSGTLSYETVGSLTRANVGQSLVISMGGDVVAGTDFVDGLRVFEHDDDTKAIILCGEVGGTAEEEAAEWIKVYRKRTKNPKPIAALIGGIEAKPGRIMGHAGAWAGLGEKSAADKRQALANAGVTMVDHPAKFGGVMKGLLERSQFTSTGAMPSGTRTFHTQSRPHVRPEFQRSQAHQSRSLHLRADQSSTLLHEYGFTVSEATQNIHDLRSLTMTVDRSARSPCITISPTVAKGAIDSRAKRIPFDYRQGPEPKHIQQALKLMQLDAAPPGSMARTGALIHKLWAIFHQKEAIELTVNIGLDPSKDEIVICSPRFFFDDAAFRSCKRQADLHAQRDISLEDATEVSAEKDGIVYIKLDAPIPEGAKRNVGTLVNGAGLAMNTVDALTARGAYPTNFLDTGGKATSETVKRSFELILADERVDVIFVNIFGGLTLGDMIAKGVLLAFKELSMTKPVVVRIRGTNEKEGQKIIAESGLDLFAYDDFEDAAAKVLELAGGKK